MLRQSLIKPNAIKIILFLQFISLILFPPETYSLTNQEWWLPALLAVMVAAAIYQILARRSLAIWPWYLISFAQGFNIISRLMLILPHAMRNDNGVQVFNTPYFLLSLISMALSAFMLWYAELPEVRLGLVHE